MKRTIDIHAASLYDRCIYLVSEKDFFLYQIDFDKGLFQKKVSIPSEKEVERPYEQIVKYRDGLCLVPFNAYYLSFYLPSKDEWRQIDIRRGRAHGVYGGAVCYDHFIFIFGSTVPEIIRYDIDSEKIDYILDWTHKVEQFIFDSRDAFFRSQAVIEGGNLIIPFCNANAVLRLNCFSLESQIIRIDAKENGYSGIAKYKNGFLLSPRDSSMPVVLCDNNFEVKKEYKNRYEDKRAGFSGVAVSGHHARIYSTGRHMFYGDDIVVVQKSLLLSSQGEIIYYLRDKQQLIIESNGKTVFSQNINNELNYDETWELFNDIVTEDYGKELKEYLQFIER